VFGQLILLDDFSAGFFQTGILAFSSRTMPMEKPREELLPGHGLRANSKEG
jgi:hypothetical protein